MSVKVIQNVSEIARLSKGVSYVAIATGSVQFRVKPDEPISQRTFHLLSALLAFLLRIALDFVGLSLALLRSPIALLLCTQLLCLHFTDHPLIAGDLFRSRAIVVSHGPSFH